MIQNRGAALAAIVLFALPLVSQFSRTDKNITATTIQSSQDTHSEQNTPTEISPVVVVTKPAPSNENGKEEGKHSEEDGSEFYVFLGRKIKISDSLLIFATFLLVVVTYLLYRATERLVRGADRTAERQLRAYVSVSPNQLVDFEIGKDPYALLHVKNSGSTPAFKFRYVAGFEQIDRDIINSDNVLVRDDKNQAIPTNVLHPNVELKIVAPLRKLLLKSNYLNIGKEVESSFYAFGCVFYEDAFGRDRITEFCFELDGGVFTASENRRRLRDILDVPNDTNADLKSQAMLHAQAKGVEIFSDAMWVATNRHNKAT